MVKWPEFSFWHIDWRIQSQHPPRGIADNAELNKAVLQIRDVYPGKNFFIPSLGSRVRKISDPGSGGIHIKEFKYFNPKNVSKLSEI
jgi:hypothetical protein